MAPRYVIGIDLGTTNSVLAYAPLEAESLGVELLPTPQFVARGTVENVTGLPSFLYLATDQETQQAVYDLPWAAGRQYAVGELARRQSADVPDRTVSAAKSWLCHGRVDRHEPILPWNAPDEVPKISPVTASQRYLEHLAAAWNAAFPGDPLAQQRVVLTVPASFDASARELTRQAAQAAGLPDEMVLLEEPQAAVYAWLAACGDGWRRLVQVGDTLLVCDVGGGTTDLTLVAVTEEQGELALERMAVGRHILVGGDNMDLALAHDVADSFAAKGVQLDPWQSVALWHSCRAAKEKLLAAEGPSTHPVAVLGRGSKLIGRTIAVDVDRARIAELLLDGFFPQCLLSDRPARQRFSGFQELGLPFEADAAVTRHVAAFLSAHGDEDQPARPSHVLFNGGVFKAPALSRRLMQVLGSWFTDQPPQVLEGPHDLDHAVSRGAAAYGYTQHRGGVRIRGGTARSYYVGIETAGLAVPGARRPLHALCVVPQGMEEGSQLDVPSAEIGLIVGEPAQFRFFSSPLRKHDQPGDVLRSWSDEELVETDPLEALLPADDEADEHFVPVRFQSKVTELGMLELWCVSPATEQRWKLEFNVRGDEG